MASLLGMRGKPSRNGSGPGDGIAGQLQAIPGRTRLQEGRGKGMPAGTRSESTVTQHGNHTAAGRGHGNLERVTVNLTPKSSRALEDSAQRTGDTKTDTINRALQVYEYIEGIITRGGAVYVREDHAGELERLKIF